MAHLKFLKTILFYFLLIFIFSPQILIFADEPEIKNKLNLNDWNAIISIIASSIVALVGILGLILGYYYYKSRLEYDQCNVEKEKKRCRLQIIFEQLEAYNAIIERVFILDIQNENELTKLRDKIERSFELIEICLELNDKLFNFTNEEIKTILAVNSFVDKNALIMRENFDSLSRQAFQSIRLNYIDKIQKARGVCLNKME